MLPDVAYPCMITRRSISRARRCPISKSPVSQRPLSGPFRELVDGLRVITGLLAVRSFLLMFTMSGDQRPDKSKTHDKAFPYLAYTTRYTDNTKFADQMIPGRILQNRGRLFVVSLSCMVAVAKKSDIDCGRSQDLRVFHVPVAETRPVKDKEGSFMPSLSSPACHWDTELTSCPKLNKAVGFRRLMIIIIDVTSDPWETQTPRSSAVVTFDDAASRGSPEQGIQCTTCSQQDC